MAKKNDHDLRVILESTYRAFSNMAGFELKKDLIVYNNLKNHPFIYGYEGDVKEISITLNIDNAMLWCKIIFQFSHELCHAFCDFNVALGHKQKWFEEVLCDAASISIFNYIYNNFEKLEFSKYSNFTIYKENFKSYIEDILQEYNTPRNLSKEEISEFIKQNIKALQEDATDREKNRVISNYLCEQFFFGTPSRWKAIKYFNKWEINKECSFEEFISNWLTVGDGNVKAIVKSLSI